MSLHVGLISRKGDDVTPMIRRILIAASPTKADCYGLATIYGAHMFHGRLEPSLHQSPMALGYKLTKIKPLDNPQPIHQGSQAISMVGRIWGVAPSPQQLADLVRNNVRNGLEKALNLDGCYSACVAEDGLISCIRDPVGLVPMYYGISADLVGVASNMKMLWSIGLEAINLEPGQILELSSKGMELRKFNRLTTSSIHKRSIEETINDVDKILYQAVERRLAGFNDTALAFSGGLDSSIIAFYLREVGSQPRLFCVGSESSPDFEAAEIAADSLGLPLSLHMFGEEEFERHLDSVMLSVEEPNPLKVCIAFPLYFAARMASERGLRTIFTGNGADELFGGYARYVEKYLEDGQMVRDSMRADVLGSHGKNLERDWKVCADLGVELKLPFMDVNMVNYALGLPIEYLLTKNEAGPRKIILRHLAKQIGLPKAVTERPKKAAQYSSGASKMLNRLAKRKKMDIQNYLQDRWRKIKGRSGP